MTRKEFEKLVQRLEKITFNIYDAMMSNRVEYADEKATMQALRNWKRVLAFANFYGVNVKGGIDDCYIL